VLELINSRKKFGEKTREVLAKPDIILAQLTEAACPGNLDSLETEIKELNSNIKKYEQRKKNLLEAMELGEFEKDEILDRLNNLKRLRIEDENKLNDLIKTRDNITGLAEAKIKLNQLYDRVMDNLENATSEIKRLAFDALAVRVYASPKKYEIKGVIPLQLPLSTIEQTSGCLPFHAYIGI
jgi:chromosome segregation ATPase